MTQYKRDFQAAMAKLIGAEMPEDPNAGVLRDGPWPSDPEESLLAAKLVRARWDEANGFERRMAEQVLPTPKDPDPVTGHNETIVSLARQNDLVLSGPVGRI